METSIEMTLNLAKICQFSWFESNLIIFGDPIDELKEDVYGTSIKFEQEKGHYLKS